jgi:hypothetical protein
VHTDTGTSSLSSPYGYYGHNTYHKTEVFLLYRYSLCLLKGTFIVFYCVQLLARKPATVLWGCRADDLKIRVTYFVRVQTRMLHACSCPT